MIEIIVGLFVLFIIGATSKNNANREHKDYIIPLFFDPELEETKHSEKSGFSEYGCDECESFDDFEEYDF